MKAIVVRQHGGPEVLTLEEMPVPAPQANQVLVRNHFVGVNFVDLQHRAGLYYPVALPLIPGTEAAGEVTAVGNAVTAFRPGDRVAYAGYMGGDYAEWTCVPQDRLVVVPAELSLEQAAAVLLQGTTAYVLTHDVYSVRPGEWVLVHAAASGVGALLVQMAKDRGAPVIGTTSAAQKARLVRQAGADEVVVSTEQDLVAAVQAITAGRGVQVVYDGVGGALFEPSLNVLQARGYLVEFGMAGGRPPLLDVSRLSGITGGPNKGSLFVTWASAGDYLTTPEALRACAAAVFQMVLDERLRQQIAGVFPLAEAAHAHQLLENRAANGKLLLQAV